MIHYKTIQRFYLKLFVTPISLKTYLLYIELVTKINLHYCFLHFFPFNYNLNKCVNF